MVCKCIRCGWTWNERHIGDIPKWCPNCNTKYWNKERIETRGVKSREKMVD